MLAGLIVIGLVCGLASIDPDVSSTESDRRIDWIGAGLVTAGLVLIVFVLAQGEIAPKRWSTPCTCHRSQLFFSVSAGHRFE